MPIIFFKVYGDNGDLKRILNIKGKDELFCIIGKPIRKHGDTYVKELDLIVDISHSRNDFNKRITGLLGLFKEKVKSTEDGIYSYETKIDISPYSEPKHVGKDLEAATRDSSESLYINEEFKSYIVEMEKSQPKKKGVIEF
jgi:hypothetical protein